jgi:RNA polymerase sigma-70 factor, ECF subfamily
VTGGREIAAPCHTPRPAASIFGMDSPLDVERYRPRLFGIAYRMLGDVDDARDLVQETFLRWHQADRDGVVAPEGWLVAVVTRLAIDQLRRATHERQAYTGPWLPEPFVTEPPPDRGVELASDLSMALLVLLERLAPEERAAFLLREVFDAGYDEIARVLERSEPAARQVVHRARTRVRGDRARFAARRAEHGGLLSRFLDALHAGDRDGLLALFAPDATFVSDGGGKVSAARRQIAGADRLVRMFMGLERKWSHLVAHRIASVNGEPAIVTEHEGRVLCVTAFASDGERLTAGFRVLNPDKLRHVGPPAR